MANIREYRDKNGILKAFYIRVFRGRNIDGKQLPPYQDIFEVQPTWSETTARKKAEAYAAVFEDKCQNGLQGDGRQTFQEYAEYVIQLKADNGDIVHSTEVRYHELAQRIYPEIGYLKLKEIRPQHLNKLYQKIKKDGAVKTTACAKIKLQKVFDEGKLGSSADMELLRLAGEGRKLSRMAVGRAANISASTVSMMLRGENVQKDKAAAVAKALGYSVEQLFSISKIKEELSQKTVLEHHRFISAVFAVADKEGLVPFNIAAKASPPKYDYPEAVFYPPELVKEIIAAVKQESIVWRAMALLIIYTGGRRGEILALRRGDLDFERSRLRITQDLVYTPDRGKYIEPRPKNKRRRYVSVPSNIMAELKAYLVWRDAAGLVANEKWEKYDLTFINVNGEPYNPDSITEWFARLSKKYDLPHIHPHGFRHSVASALIFEGIDGVSVAGTLGHANANTTNKIYAHFIDAAEERNAEVISRVYGS